MDITEQLIRDERLVLYPYRDSRGFMTIGVGHNLDARGISERAAIMILDDDIQDTKTALLGKFPWMRDLSPARLGAFINLAFNMGVAGLSEFRKTLRLAESGEWVAASEQLLESLYATQVGDRARRVAQQLKTDEWV